MQNRVLLCLCAFAACLSLGAANLYDYTAVDIHGNEVSLEKYRGKVLLLVNVASQCAFTDFNYKELTKLQETYEHRGFTVLAFPCNQFGSQEPGTNEEILRFTKENYNANFPLFSKIDVYGDNAHEIYQYLSGITGTTPSWNFCKYLVDKDGNVVQYTNQAPFDNVRKSLDYLLRKHSEL